MGLRKWRGLIWTNYSWLILLAPVFFFILPTRVGLCVELFVLLHFFRQLRVFLKLKVVFLFAFTPLSVRSLMRLAEFIFSGLLKVLISPVILSSNSLVVVQPEFFFRLFGVHFSKDILIMVWNFGILGLSNLVYVVLHLIGFVCEVIWISSWHYGN